MLHRCLVAGLFGVFSLLTPLSAQTEMVGTEAPAFNAGTMMFDNDVSARTLEDCRGEVIMIKYWGLNCPPCKAAMPGIQRMWGEYKDKGFHLFHVESQGHSQDEVQAYCEKMNYSFPQTLPAGSSFGGYNGGNGLPYAFVIGVEGKVVWQGRSGYETIIAQEIAKIKYAGLGMPKVAAGLEKAATLFSGKQYMKALKEAQKAAEKADAPAELKEDAQRISARVEAVAAHTLAFAEAAEAKREFASAQTAYESLVQNFKGLPAADSAAAKLESFKGDKEIKKELQAEKALLALLEQVKKAPTKERQTELLNGFAAQFTGTTAAEKAKKKVSYL